MTGAAPSAPRTPAQAAGWMREIAAELTAAGLTAQVNNTHSALDITAVLRRPGRRNIKIIIDDDGYAEIRYWNPPEATPAQIAITISRALTAILTTWPS
jgi:hypothetical protein